MEKKRDATIDIAKGIGIYLVCLGHTTSNEVVLKWLYSFHMPLFFFLSGIFHSRKKNYKEFLMSKINGIIIPYLFFSLVLFVYFLIVSKNIGFSAKENLSIKENFMAIFTGMDILNLSHMSWGVQLWFLLSLFTVANIVYFIERLSFNFQILANILLILLNVIMTKIIDLYFFKTFYINLPWAFLTSLIAVNFYWCGIKIKNKILENSDEINCNILALLVLFILNIVTTYYNKAPDMYSNFYGNNLFVFYLEAYLGIFFVIFFIKKYIKKNNFLQYIGKNSIIILAFHNRIRTLTRVFFVYFLGREIPNGNIIFDLVYSWWEILLCIPIIIILNKYFPFFIGKGKKNERKI